MTARPIRRNAQTPDRNGKIFYTSTTSLSHISKQEGNETYTNCVRLKMKASDGKMTKESSSNTPRVSAPRCGELSRRDAGGCPQYPV